MAIKWLISTRATFGQRCSSSLGLKGMVSPVSARKGIIWAGVGMVLATVVTSPRHEQLCPDGHRHRHRRCAGLVSGKKVAMTDMPQMVAICNGMGGGALRRPSRSSLPAARCIGTVVTLLATLAR